MGSNDFCENPFGVLSTLFSLQKENMTRDKVRSKMLNFIDSENVTLLLINKKHLYHESFEKELN